MELDAATQLPTVLVLGVRNGILVGEVELRLRPPRQQVGDEPRLGNQVQHQITAIVQHVDFMSRRPRRRADRIVAEPWRV
jgi:hypothetical protein